MANVAISRFITKSVEMTDKSRNLCIHILPLTFNLLDAGVSLLLAIAYSASPPRTLMARERVRIAPEHILNLTCLYRVEVPGGTR
jgi:hypothetical protein